MPEKQDRLMLLLLRVSLLQNIVSSVCIVILLFFIISVFAANSFIDCTSSIYKYCRGWIKYLQHDSGACIEFDWSDPLDSCRNSYETLIKRVRAHPMLGPKSRILNAGADYGQRLSAWLNDSPDMLMVLQEHLIVTK